MEIHLNVRRPGVRDAVVADHEKESDRDYDNEDFDRVERSFFIFGIRHVASFGGWYMFMVILTKTLFSNKIRRPRIQQFRWRASEEVRMRSLYRFFTMLMVFVTMVFGSLGSDQVPMTLFGAIVGSSTAQAADCPVVAFTAQGNAETIWFHNDSTGAVTYVDADNDWKATPYTTLPTSVSWTDDVHAVGTTSNASEWGMGIDASGNIQTFGSNAVTTSVPSGSGPYSSPRGGSLARYSALNGSGTPVNWGLSTNSWLTSEPTTTGWTSLDVGRDVGCAVSTVNSAGVTCWGYDLEGMIASASRPTTGTYQSVAVGRYVVLAVDTSGNMVGWRTTRAASGMITTADAFIANMPTTGVESVDVSETGELVGVAWMSDGTVRIWQDPGKAQQGALKSAPGFTAYGSGSLRSYTPQGPSGNITFRSQPFISPYGHLTTSTVAGVIDDPKGLVDLGVGTYAFGYAVYWTGVGRTLGGTTKFEPILADACN